MQTDDIYIIEKCIRGNARMQRLLYDKYKVKWLMICLRYSRHKQEAEDMLQEGLISVFNNLRKFDPNKADFAPWSNKIMVNAALQYLRKWIKLNFNQTIEEHQNFMAMDESIYDALGAKELTAIIQKLPDGYRVVFNMYVIEGYKHREIAEILNISESTSKTQLLKAKNMLRNRLEKVLNY